MRFRGLNNSHMRQMGSTTKVPRLGFVVQHLVFHFICRYLTSAIFFHEKCLPFLHVQEQQTDKKMVNFLWDANLGTVWLKTDCPFGLHLFNMHVKQQIKSCKFGQNWNALTYCVLHCLFVIHNKALPLSLLSQYVSFKVWNGFIRILFYQ